MGGVLWLDLNPSEWPAGKSPTDHPIISAILTGDPLPQQYGNPSEEEVANHQETEDLPIVMDSDSTQYAALLAGKRGVWFVNPQQAKAKLIAAVNAACR